MRLLDRYLLRELLLPLGYCLGGFLIFWISFDLLKDLDRFQKHGLNVADIIEFYLVTGPEFFLETMPIGLLLALLYALTTHARHNELTAMRAAGISLWRFSAPYFAVGLFFSLTFFAVNEFWVPDISERAEAILNRRDASQSDPLTAEWRRDLKFLNSRDNRAWWIKSYNLKTSEMQNPVIDWRFPDGQRQMISARSGIFSGGAWKFSDVKQISYTSAQDIAPKTLATNILEFTDWPETPALIKSEIKISSLNSKQAAKRPQLSITDILNYLELHPRLDRATRALIKTQLHGRIAAPWTCLVVVLIALPFGAISGRRNVFVGVASSIFICFSYFILLRLGLALGTGGYLPGWLAAWMPNILFGSASLWLTMRVR
ncbi:MAG: LptF/LptG family permease [Verrucomicrobiota bacterium]